MRIIATKLATVALNRIIQCYTAAITECRSPFCLDAPQDGHALLTRKRCFRAGTPSNADQKPSEFIIQRELHSSGRGSERGPDTSNELHDLRHRIFIIRRKLGAMMRRRTRLRAEATTLLVPLRA